MIFRSVFIFLMLFLVFSCGSNSGEEKDNSDLYAKSQQVDEIIKRSGTKLDPDSDMALADAENRLRTGGGLFGKKGIVFDDLFFQNQKEGNNQSASIGLPINSILWKSSLDVISFMPISSADPFSGVIITDWYTGKDSALQRCKLNVFIKGMELKSSNLDVNSFCQKNMDGTWVDIENNNQNDIKIENAILNKAKKIKLSIN
tara:strand:+ start:49 stop:654 length:606 start_codon:yes stop_codon:yes gene_type:complete